MLRHNSFIKAEVKICRLRIVKIEKILTVTYRTLLPKTTNFLKNGGWKKCLYLKIISYSTKYIKLIQGLYISFSRNRQDRLRHRFYASFRMAANSKRTPKLTRKVKNCNTPQNKIKSAMFWQKSYRLEWYLIIWHYLNLYVYSISFIARHFLLWKLTGAKFNFESMFQQEQNPKQKELGYVCPREPMIHQGGIHQVVEMHWIPAPKLDTHFITDKINSKGHTCL